MTGSKTTHPTAADIMQRDLLTISQDARLTELTALFDEHQVSGLPVTDAAGKIVGVASLRDVVEYYAEEPDSTGASTRVYASTDDEDRLEFTVPEGSSATVADVMSGQVHEVPDSATVPEIAARMLDLGVHRLLVADSEKQHLGLVTTFDVLRAVARP